MKNRRQKMDSPVIPGGSHYEPKPADTQKPVVSGTKTGVPGAAGGFSPCPRLNKLGAARHFCKHTNDRAAPCAAHKPSDCHKHIKVSSNNRPRPFQPSRKFHERGIRMYNQQSKGIDGEKYAAAHEQGRRGQKTETLPAKAAAEVRSRAARGNRTAQ